jgi:hypothetical protein
LWRDTEERSRVRTERRERCSRCGFRPRDEM